jgi:outer membrane lipoprotein-sorting protein
LQDALHENAMNYLRRISTLRLLAIGAALTLFAAASAAIALAATGGGPTPPPKPLAEAVHDALSAPPVEGVTARVHFTDNLIGESVLEGSDPLLGGASGRLWASADGRLRLELQADVSKSSGGDFQVVVDKRSFTVYDPGTETAYEGMLPQSEMAGGEEAGKDEAPSLARVREGIEEAMKHADLSGAIPSDVAGQAAYTLRASPKENGGLVGAAELAWDAANGAPLQAAVYAKGESSPVLELSATEVSFGPVAESVFEVSPPPGAKVVDLNPPSGGAGNGSGDSAPVTGLEAVRAKASFPLSSPPSLAGMARDQVRLVSSGEDAGALLTYGKGLGGIAVLELPAGEAGSGEGDEGGGLQLPSVSIEGASQAQELETPLGTLIRFHRGGVEYTVAGSVTPAVAREAAQGL